MTDKKQTKIYLWSVPRSLSTAFLRAIENRKNMKVIAEPYLHPYGMGKDRISSVKEDKNPTMTMMKAYEEIEAKTRENTDWFIKDHAVCVMCRENPLKWIPNGFQNTFLFRNPNKIFKSGYNMLAKITKLPEDKIKVMIVDYEFLSLKHVWNLYQLLTREHPNQRFMVIDGDDFADQPEKILRKYCDHVGLDYEESMLDWSQKQEVSVTVECHWKAYYQDVINSSTVDKSIIERNSKNNDLPLPDYVHKCIQDDMQYYHRLQAVKITVQQ